MAEKNDSPDQRISRVLPALLCGVALLLLPYVGSFLWFLAFPPQFTYARNPNGVHRLVIFSDDANVHCAARTIYWPLIRTIGRGSYFPDWEEHDLLFGAQIPQE